MITDTEGKLLAAAEYSSKSLLITRFAYASAIRLNLPTATGIHKMAEVLEENTTPAQDYERGRFAIPDLFASSRPTRVVYGVADSDVTGLPYVTDALADLWSCRRSA